jgi:membrane fusion protein (multidrug efflux system)
MSATDTVIPIERTPQARETSPPPSAGATGRMAALRRPLLAGLAGVVVLGAAGAGGYWLLIGARFVETDNAYVGADSAEVTPLVGGPVSGVEVHDTQAVRRGQVLVELDDTDARIALASAEADLDRARRQVVSDLSTDRALSAQIASRAAAEARAAASVRSSQADLDRAQVDLERRQALAGNGAVSGDELTRAQNAFSTARAALEAAKAAQVQAAADRAAASGALQANAALTDGASVEANPQVAAARAKVDQAAVDLARTVIRAPIDGIVTRRDVQIGQRVAAGATLMQVVPIQQAYVDANFKEQQLSRVRIGQPVTLTADLYGGSVTYHGQVVGLSGGTGAAFSLIPAQNATGNWIKVVQRLPVRIAIDPTDLRVHPLRVGLSMNVTVDTAR